MLEINEDWLFHLSTLYSKGRGAAYSMYGLWLKSNLIIDQFHPSLIG